jgi:hypothetical protein
MGLASDFIDDCLIEYRQQCRVFSEDAFVRFAIRKSRTDKKSARVMTPSDMESVDNEQALLSTMDHTWFPEQETINHLIALGFTLDDLVKKVPGFVFYYNSRTNKTTQYSVDMQFVHHVKFVSRHESVQEQDNRQLLEALPVSLDGDWLPEVATISHLSTLGFSVERIFEQVPSFIFYYNSRTDKPTRYSVDMQFVHHVKFVETHELAQQDSVVESAVDHMPVMYEGWWPCKKTFAILDANYSIPEVIAVGYVDEFVLYWQERQTSPKSKSWKSAFIQFAIRKHEKEQKEWGAIKHPKNFLVMS